MQEGTRSESAVSPVKRDRIPWGWVVATAIGLEVATVISAFAWVAIYSYLIHPGEASAYYESYAQRASPIVSVVLALPYWFLACRWVGRKAGTRAVAMCMWAWVILFVLDLPPNLWAEHKAYDWSMVAISHPMKLLGACLGGRAALKHGS